jgi:phosphoketolase
VFDNPELIALACVGDGEAETGPLATSWHINKFINPISDGAVLPVLHLNGYKIANPTLLARIPKQELDSLMVGYGWQPLFVEGHEPMAMHRAMAAAMDQAVARIREIQAECRRSGVAVRRPWPMIVLRSPKGRTAPATVHGHRVEGLWHPGGLADGLQPPCQWRPAAPSAPFLGDRVLRRGPRGARPAGGGEHGAAGAAASRSDRRQSRWGAGVRAR